MKKILILLLILVIPLFAVQLKSYTFNNGGGSSAGDEHLLNSSIGEAIGGTVDEGSVRFNSGYIVVSTAVDAVDEETEQKPVEFELVKAYPNPFNSHCNIDFTVPKQGKVNVKIFRNNGRNILNETKDVQAGSNTLTWHADDVESGVYLVKISTEEKVLSQKLILMK